MIPDRRRRPLLKPINLAEKLALFSTHWDPHVIADYNDNDVMVVRFQGAFPFHLHEDTDDFFLVLDGQMIMDIEDRSHVVETGELFIVPKGVTHRPRAEKECRVLLIEPKGEPNTGDPATAAPKPRI
jgi:mannose-6-phosphate isomerase-like protein (cupin superfamily)